jgi:PAS domain S-box-containing protein
MNKAVADISSLFAEFEDNQDQTGSLRSLRDLLAPLQPLQLLLLDGEGVVMAEDDFAGEIDSEATSRLSSMIFDHLQGKSACYFPFSTISDNLCAFAVRLSLEDEDGILAGVLQAETFDIEDLQNYQAVLATGGKMAWIAVKEAAQAQVLQTRVRHLLAEEIALKASHSEAINNVVQEREERLLEQASYAARLNSVLNAAADGILVTNETGVIESFNPTAEQIFQYNSQEMIGRNIVDLIPALNMEGNESKLFPPRGISPGVIANLRRGVDGMREDKNLCPLEMAISSTWVGNQCIFTGIVGDITERRKTEHEFYQLHLQIQMILDSAGEGILGADREGRIIFANPAAAKMLGTRPEELIGKSTDDEIRYTHCDGKPCPREENPLIKTIEDGQIRHLNNDLFWNRTGSSFPVQCTCTPIREGADILGTVLTFADITERRLLETQLSQAQKLESIGQLAAGIAHEINTPTQYIGDNTHFLQDAFDGLYPILLSCKALAAAKESSAVAIPSADMLESLRRSDIDYLLQEIPLAIEQSLEGVERVSKIVQSMKEFSHPGANIKQAVNLNRAIESTLTVARNEWKYVAELQLDLAPDLPPVMCLPGDLNQVFLNLIVNSAHAMEAKLGESPQQKGTLTVRTRHAGDNVAVQIQDTGTGIAPNIQNRVYDPFFTTKKVGRGTGQGLAIARSIVVDRHGGDISFETEMGQGTTFTISIPIQPPTTVENGDNREETNPVLG